MHLSTTNLSPFCWQIFTAVFWSSVVVCSSTADVTVSLLVASPDIAVVVSATIVALSKLWVVCSTFASVPSINKEFMAYLTNLKGKFSFITTYRLVQLESVISSCVWTCSQKYDHRWLDSLIWLNLKKDYREFTEEINRSVSVTLMTPFCSVGSMT